MSGSRSRSRSPTGAGGSGGRGSPAYDDYDEKPKMDGKGVETMKIDHAAAAFVLGRGGSTKRKIERVSECNLDLDEKDGTIELRGTQEQRDRARDYVNFVDQQRTGAVVVDVDRTDLTVVAVPEDCCGFVMGKGGATLRSMEEEWGTLMCFAKVDDREKLCIFGNFRARHGCELKIMSAIEHKRRGHCVDGDQLLFDNRIPSDQNEDGWDVDTILLADDDFAYALGARGSTRRKLAKASGCIIEYVGRLACMAGYPTERERANEYLKWLLEQRTGKMATVDITDRDDVTAMEIKQESVGFITGHKGEGLRQVESRTGTFIFTNPNSRAADGVEEVLIFGADRREREKARGLIEDRQEDHARGGRKYGGGYGGGRGGYRDNPRGRSPPRRGRSRSRSRDRDRRRDRDRDRDRDRRRDRDYDDYDRRDRRRNYDSRSRSRDRRRY